MSEQRHVIKRQVIELTIVDAARAQPLQDEVGRIYRQRIIPLIDRYCTEFSSTDRLHRIDSLDLDVGALDSQRLEEDLVEKVEAVLRRALAAKIDAQEEAAIETGSDLKAQSQLELFALFVRTGSLPWWADTSQAGILAVNLEQLLRESTEALRQLFRELVREPAARQRIIQQYTDEQLAALCGLLEPAYESSLRRDVRKWRDLLQKTEMAANAAPEHIRRSLWNNILLVASLPKGRRDGVGGQQRATLTAFYWAILQRVAADLGATGSAMLSGIRQVVQNDEKTSAKSSFLSLVRELLRAETGAPIPAGDKLSGRLAHWQPSAGALSGLWAELRSLVARLPASVQEKWRSALEDLDSQASLRDIAGRIFALLPSVSVRQDDPDKKEYDRLARILRAILEAQPGSQVAIRQDQTNTTEDKNAPDETKLNLPFSENDALPIDNAGLVILWPFLTAFFTHLGLMEEKQFKDLAARQRAVGLLQVIATEDAAPPEYLLPLNKLLCGLDLKQVFEFGPPLRKSEKKECASLLKAVIAQAPILRDMSAAGFRGSFLLRRGQISNHDGLWLLRVERQTYDIVLERFPWSWEWVKLPWMDAPLRVEW